MSNFLMKAGIFVLACNAIFLLIDTFLFKERSVLNDFIDDIFYGGAGLLAAGVLVKVLGSGISAISIKRCPRCGKPVEKNSIYCETHLKETINEYQDQLHNAK
ncbi:MAG: hypothetical protein AB1756_05410 [Acidobacteriota bacterium]